MSREIKFRAWDKERKDMRGIQLMDWSDWWVSTGHTWEREKRLQYGERNSFKNAETDRHILMQYTGLKDKNGREIYEGDLVYVTQWKNKYKVIFDDGMFKASGKAKFSLITIMGEVKCEVIGNIYESPELIHGT